MKYIKLTGWGNNKTHLIPLKAINSFSEEDKYTMIRLDNGSVINVQESFSMVEEILDLAGAQVYDADDVENLQAQIDAYEEMEADRFAIDTDGYELPF
jgi:hypothetical protein